MKEQKITKKDKKRNNYLLIIFLSIFIFGIGLSIGILIGRVKKDSTILDKQDDIVDIYSIEPIIKDYGIIGKSHIYLYNTNEIKLNDNTLFSDYLKKYKNIDNLFTDIKDYLDITKTLKDGGTVIYQTKSDNKLFKNNLTIIKCHTSDGNEDIYLGEYLNTLTAFQNGACGKNFFTSKQFTRTYTIKKITLVGENKYELVLEDENNKSVTITKTMSEDSREVLTENALFTFHFTNKYGELIKEDIAEIFEKAQLVGIVPYGK